MKSYCKIIIVAVLLFGFSGCQEIQVENANEPSLKNYAGEPEAILNLAGEAFKILHNGMQEYDGPASPMGVMADQNTCPWGFQAVKDLSSEPRMGYINSLSYAYYTVVNVFWRNCYESISLANDILRLTNEIETEGNNETLQAEMLQAWSYFVSGVAHGYLGLTYDKAHLVTGDSATDSLGYTHWQNVINYSLTLLDKSIAIAKNTSFEVPVEWMGGEPYSSKELAELVNSYAARILTYSSRYQAHNQDVDWARVLQYAQNGIKKDLAPLMGDAYDFYDFYLVYAIYPGWTRIDHRIINLMDPDYPSRWPMDGKTWTTPDRQDPGPASSVDARLEADFEYLEENNFVPDRGYYHFSHYRHIRYADFIARVWYGDIPKPSFLVWENELLKAEAYLRLGNRNEAIAILNDPDGARQNRGKLPDITNTDPIEILWYIFYERDIELINTGMGISYFDMRRRDMLQRGTILHFPVPATELQITMDEHYTIGGAPDGINVSKGSWTGLDGLTSPLN